MQTYGDIDQYVIGQFAPYRFSEDKPQKKVKPLELPLYIISLVEHKTQVEYNVIMQLFRYMVHIWEDYEKEMEQAITMHILRMVRQSASDV